MKKYVTETFVLNPPTFQFSNIDKFKNEIIYIKKDKENYHEIYYYNLFIFNFYSKYELN